MADNRIDIQLERLSAAKTAIKEAIIEKLPANETFSAEKLDGYPNEIRKITTTKELTGATATENDILAGKTAYGNNGAEINGNIPIIAAEATTITENNVTHNIEKGYHEAGGTVVVDLPDSIIHKNTSVAADDNITIDDKYTTITVGKGYVNSEKTIEINRTNLVAENIKYNTSILGINGTFSFEPTSPITTDYVLKDKIGYVNGKKVVGRITTYEGEFDLKTFFGKLLYDNFILDTPSTFLENLPNSYNADLYRNGYLINSIVLTSPQTVLQLTKHSEDSIFNYRVKISSGQAVIAESDAISFPKQWNDNVYQDGDTFSWRPIFAGFTTNTFYYEKYTINGTAYYDLPNIVLNFNDVYDFYTESGHYNGTTSSSPIYNSSGFTDSSGKLHYWKIPESWKNDPISIYKRYYQGDKPIAIVSGCEVYTYRLKVEIVEVTGMAYLDVQYQLATKIYLQTNTNEYTELSDYGEITFPTYKTNISDEILSKMIKKISSTYITGNTYTLSLFIQPGGKDYIFKNMAGIAYNLTVQ